MINFCDWRLKTEITCDKVSFDGYSPENLVSRNLSEKGRGFLSESFVKPPVNLTVHLPCNIEIYQIVMDPQVGAQKSTGIDIYTASGKKRDSWLYCGCNQAACNTCNISISSFDISNLIFVSVAKLCLNPPGKVCFQNPRYSDARNVPDWVTSSSEYKFHRELRHRDKWSLANVSHITIRITRTGLNSAALKNLEIWGRLASSCSRAVHQTVSSLIKSTETSAMNESLRQNKVTPSVSVENLPSTSQVSATISIPDDFVDPITCEIMALPVVLPCGKNIDQLTLDKHIEREAAWGRPPSDPFTGVTFTNKTKPFPNASLKARIDSFLLQYGDKFKDAPRTVGSKTIMPKTPTTFTNQDIPLLTKSSSNTSVHQHPQTPQLSTSRKLKRDLMSSSTHDLRYNQSNKRLKTESAVGLVSSSSSSHEDELQLSLNAAIDSTLDNLTSFTQFNKDEKTFQVQQNHCTICSLDFNKTSVSKYQLPCKHIICRPCLLAQSTDITCQACDRKFSSKDVSKIHH